MSQNANKPKGASLLDAIKEGMRQEMRDEIRKVGMTDTLLNECRELAGNGVKLLGLLEKHGFANQLSGNDKQLFDDVMEGLSLSGIRCQVMVEESFQSEYEHFLAVTPAPSVRPN